MMTALPSAAIRRARIFFSDPHVSNEHAVIEKQGADYVVRDLGSLHGTFLNEHPVKTAKLEQADEIRISILRLVFETSAVPATRQYPRARRPSKPPEGDTAGTAKKEDTKL